MFLDVLVNAQLIMTAVFMLGMNFSEHLFLLEILVSVILRLDWEQNSDEIVQNAD